MLDTVRVKYPIAPTPEQLEHWTKRTTNTPTGERTVYLYNPKIDETTLRFTYYPMGYDGQPLLALEFSLPKLIFDNNYKMLGGITDIIPIANMQLRAVQHTPILDLAEGILIRLDVCYNHQVGECVDDYIKALGNLEYPHRRTKYHRHEGVEYKSKHKTTKFYNKERESGYQEAHGILRQEVTFIKSKDVQKLLGKRQPTLLDVSIDLMMDTLKDDLNKLGLLGNSIANADTALVNLCDAYGSHAGIFYYGLLVSRMGKAKKRIAQDSHQHPRSLDRKLKKIVDANIPLTITDREEPLPPLVINYRYG